MRALLLVLDGLGVGSAPDAGHFNTQDADTLGHLYAAVGSLELPTLFSMGLGEVIKGRVFDPPARKCTACYGRMRARSAGNDTISGHWELAGAITHQPFSTFKEFPGDLVAAISAEAKVEFLGNRFGSTVSILKEFGQDHLCTGKPILYTTASSAMQIAAHEHSLPLGRLHEICRIARRHCDQWHIGRVIARPFSGSEGNWTESPGRHDYSAVPPHTVLNAISELGLPVEGIGKVSDTFAHSGVTRSHPSASNAESFKIIEQIWNSTQSGMIFANLADFDTLYGHRRDPAGYAHALERFDDWLYDFLEEIESDDLIIITADHGNDPTFSGTGHTREEVPVLLRYDGRTGPLGIRETFADVAATLASFFNLPGPTRSDSQAQADECWHTSTPLITFHRPQGFQIP